MPQPGLCNSNNIPKKPKVVNKEATTGFVKKRTKFSDQFSEKEGGTILRFFQIPIEKKGFFEGPPPKK